MYDGGFGFLCAWFLPFGLGSARAIASRRRTGGDFVFDRVKACRQRAGRGEEEEYCQVLHAAIIAQRGHEDSGEVARQD